MEFGSFHFIFVFLVLSVCSFHAALVIQANGESSISERKAGKREDSDLLCVPVAGSGESGRLHTPMETANHRQGSSLLESFATQSAPAWKDIKTDTLSLLGKAARQAVLCFSDGRRLRSLTLTAWTPKYTENDA